MGIGKSLRFEIFARDGFICQYCGQRPPDVVLELDHIHPRSKGGDDDPLNLITSCWDCNRGKRDKVLREIPQRPDADLKFLETQQELVEAKRYLKAKKQRDEAYALLEGALLDAWRTSFDGAYLPQDGTIPGWINKYGPEEVETAFRIASPRFHSQQFGRRYHYQTAIELAKYINGILRRRAEEANGGQDA